MNGRKLLRFIPFLVISYVSFSIAAVVAIFMAPIALLFDVQYAKNVLVSMDRLMAAVLGFSGHFTVSTECGLSDCRGCKVLCRFLSMLDPQHCERNAAEPT